jgi:hypothetical protein
MSDERRTAEPTQPTRPKGADTQGRRYEPVEIPVPKVSTFRAALRTVAQAVKPEA